MEILKFYGEYCGPCKVLSNDLKTIKTKIPIKDIDIEKEQELCEFYSVKRVPTLIKINEEKEISRIEGYRDKKQLIDFLQN